MPFYPYICEDCRREFEVFVSIHKKETGWKPDCPNCGSANSRQTFGAIAMISGLRRPSSGSTCCSSKKGANQ